LRVVTWLGEPRGARVDRQYLVFRELAEITDVSVRGRLVFRLGTPADDALAVQATTEWVFANNQGHPRRIPTEVVSLFRAGPAERTGENPGRA
jgi:acyl-CoA thioesterase FadM